MGYILTYISIQQAVNYRLAPETKFPGALYDAVQSYLYLIDPNEKHQLNPKNIMVMGDSAGGGLCLAMMLYLRDHGLPQPEGAVLLSVKCCVTHFMSKIFFFSPKCVGQ